ncbi:hypothetical protein [Streptomyces sp. NPDC051219]|uniref:hypothetical protein n=1 Tax=Streptomyces sp. NPDC051219 TaxID=3155283 RepID=UPI00343990D1
MSTEQTPAPTGPSPGLRPGGTPPARLTAAAALTALEGIALAAVGVYLLVMGLLGDPDSAQQAETGGLTLIALAVIPLAAARGLRLCRRWSRGPALIMQLIAVPVVWTLVQTGGVMTAAGIALGVVAAAVLALLVNPTATRALGIGPRDPRGA